MSTLKTNRIENLTTTDGGISINNSGQVGVGTTSPNFTLDIEASSATASIQSTTGTNTAYLNFNNTAGNAYVGLESSAGAGFVTDTPAYALCLAHQGAYPISFATNNAERMRIDSSGRLLVGTASDVSGGLSTTLIQGVASGGGYVGLARNDTSVDNGNGIGGLRFYANDPSGYNDVGIVQCVADGAHATDDYPTRLEFHTTGDGASSPTERMRIDSSGKVGIGTASPVGKLAVSDGTVTGEINPYSSSSTCFIGTRSNHPVSFQVNASEKMRIDGSGRVGIGKTNPQQKLDVTGNAFIGNGDYPWNTSNQSGIFIGNGRIDQYKRNDDTSPYLSCIPIDSSDGSLDPPVFIVNSASNVGVGIDAPTAKLHVIGNEIRFSNSSNASYYGTITHDAGTTGANIYNSVDSTGVSHIWQNSGTERMRLHSAGGVSIGTTATPTAKSPETAIRLGTSTLGHHTFTNLSTTVTDITAATGIGGLAFVQLYNTANGAQYVGLLMYRYGHLVTISETNNTGLTLNFSVSTNTLRLATSSGTVTGSVITLQAST